MRNKIAVITGASRGIGKAISCSLGKSGYLIVINYNKSKRLAEKLKSELKKSNVESILFKADVSNRSNVKELSNFLKKEFKKIDVLVNNAGVLNQKNFFSIDDSEWNESINVNLNSTFICTQELVPLIKKGGSIVNITSIGGQIGGAKATHYAASKGAIITLTKSLARILAEKNIRVNAVSPGYIRTSMFTHILKINNIQEKEIIKEIPLGFVGHADDIANAVEFLTSEKSSYITGHILNVNGGVLI